MSRRCPTHDIALNPAGHCLLCRRESLQPIADVPIEPPRRTRVVETITGIMVGIGLIVLAGRAVIGGAAAWAQLPAVEPLELEREIYEREHPSPPAITRAAPPPASQVSWRDSFPEAPSLAEAQPPAEPRIAAPMQDDRDAHAVARRRVSITMYGASWCRACRAAQDYFRAEGISFVEHDVEREPAQRAELRRRNPAGSIPTIDIDGTVLVGFSPSAIERAIDAAARRHR